MYVVCMCLFYIYYVFTYLYVRIGMYACMYVNVLVSMYVCMYVCMYGTDVYEFLVVGHLVVSVGRVDGRHLVRAVQAITLELHPVGRGARTLVRNDVCMYVRMYVCMYCMYV